MRLRFGGEGDLVKARELCVEVCLVQAGFGRSHHQRAFGGVPGDVPAVAGLRAQDRRLTPDRPPAGRFSSGGNCAGSIRVPFCENSPSGT